MRVSTVGSGDPDLPLLQVDTGTLALTFLPAVGGRLLSIVAGGRELLWRDTRVIDRELRARRHRAAWPRADGTFASWVNIGGAKTWPAPQGWGGEGEWAGPPDAVLDSGAWSVEAVEGDDGAVIVTLESMDDARSGIRITRAFTVPAAGDGFRQNTTFTNIGARPVTWSIWEVVQVDTAASAGSHAPAIEVSVDDDRVVDLGTYHGELAVDHEPGRVLLAVQDVVAKVGFPGATGSVSYVAPDGLGLAIEFDVDPSADYPDGQSRAEVWMQAPLDGPIEELSGLHPTSPLVELEALGPLVTLSPGQSTGLELRWRVLGLPGVASYDAQST